MSFANIFDAEVVKYQGKDNRTPHMAPDTRGGGTMIVVVLFEKFSRMMFASTPDCGSP